jgi:hypothetical protein
MFIWTSTYLLCMLYGLYGLQPQHLSQNKLKLSKQNIDRVTKALKKRKKDILCRQRLLPHIPTRNLKFFRGDIFISYYSQRKYLDSNFFVKIDNIVMRSESFIEINSIVTIYSIEGFLIAKYLKYRWPQRA